MTSDGSGGPGRGSPAEFLLYPAVDIRHGRVVRLVHGDAAAETVYGADPVATAADLVARGATRLHVVDLDAAFGEGSGAAVIEAIAVAVGPRVEVQVGGGLRDDDAIDRVLARGAARAILGTVALADPAFVERAIVRHGADRIAAALDVRGTVAVGGGWTQDAGGADLDRAAAALLDAGVRRFVVTAIERDGTLAGPDLALLRRVAAAGAPEVVASGGIRSLDDLEAVADAGCVGAVVGRALYAGGIDLAACVAWAAGRSLLQGGS
jgi:phosphoribosylformimino-5-aminoimidazole carboxamide ribotide isomerase